MTKEFINEAINKSLAGEANIGETELALAGFSTPTIRRLISNLCEGASTYLEVGIWGGATFCSSFNKNLTSIGIENFSQDFGIPNIKNLMEKGVEELKHKSKEVVLHYEGCFDFDINKLPNNIDIYFFDGNHSFESQAKALPYFIDKMAKTFIFIVDDTSWDAVAKGTDAGLHELRDKIEVEMAWPLRGYHLQEDPIWHNGVNIYLVNKK